MKKRIVRLFTMAGVMMLLVALMAMPAYAAGGNVSGAIEASFRRRTAEAEQPESQKGFFPYFLT